MAGDVIEVTNAQAYSLMQMGLEVLNEKKTEPEPEPDPESDTIKERFEKLNKEFREEKTRTDNKEKHEERMGKLEKLTAKSEFLKENPEHTQQVKALALSMQMIDPKLSIEQATTRVIDDFQKTEKAKDERKKAKKNSTDIVKNALSGVDAGGSGLAAIGKEKEYTAEDVFRGDSRQALQELVENMGIPEIK